MKAQREESPTFAYSLAMYLTRNGQVRDAPEMQKEIEEFLNDRGGLEKALLDGNRIAMKTIQSLKAELAAMTEDRNLWRDAHNDDCPNKAMADSLKEEQEASREIRSSLE